MPVVIALLARSLIQMAVTLGLISLAERFALPLVNRALQEVIKAFGVSEDDAKDIVANEILLFAEQVGVGVLALRTKIPSAVAERLGFTTKGFSRRTLSPRASAATARAGRATALSTEAAVIPTAAEAATVIERAKATLPGFSKALLLTFAALNTVFVGLIAINNLIDFGNWNSGAYQKTFQRIFAKITGGLLVPDQDYRQTKTASPDVFSKVFNTYKLEGAIAINDPYKLATVAFSRDALIDVIDRIGADLLRTTQRASTKDVLLATQAMIVFPPGVAEEAARPAEAGPAAPTPIKVFTGVVAQGVLGEASPFAARETDLIDSDAELRQAAINNLVPFMLALPNRIIYELKIQTSVVGKDGVRRLGTSQRVIAAYNKDGSPRFKTVTNRFAVLDIFIFTARNVRTKIDSIVLGPTDAAKLQPTREALAGIETSIRADATTTKLADIKLIQTTAPIAVAPPGPPAPREAPSLVVVPTAPAATAAPPPKSYIFFENQLYEVTPTAPALVADPDTIAQFRAGFISARVIGSRSEFEKLPGVVAPPAPAPAFQAAGPQATVPAVIIPAGNNPNRCTAQTIAEYFDTARLSYPSREERGSWYEAYGLGPAAWYTGTAEQNTKLLAELKRRQGCP